MPEIRVNQEPRAAAEYSIAARVISAAATRASGQEAAIM